MIERDYITVKKSIISLLESIPEPTESIIETFVVSMLNNISTPLDKDKLIAEIWSELVLNAHYEKPDIYEDSSQDHVKWLTDQKKKSIKWLYWNRYAEDLLEGGFNPKALDSVDDITEDILSRMEDPQREGRWDSRGMVVGYIQSGKTANYIGLICKAADAGYKLIIVLAGIHNDLRYQTQLRIDSGFIGSRKEPDKPEQVVGVGLISAKHKRKNLEVPLDVTCLTTSSPDGDFTKKFAGSRISTSPDGAPVCIVVKKNATVLRNLNEWLTDLEKKHPELPLLMIDDEADNASLNTKKYEDATAQEKEDMTSVNRQIRDILNKFDKSAYVGYTATPYANVFIDPDARSDEYGADIFPRNYIISMRSPPGYFGSDTVFGRKSSGDAVDHFPGIVLVDDDEIMLPPERRSDSTFVPKEISPSLYEAILSFILSTAVRTVRNEGVDKVIHNSMLIHVSRYIAAQGTNSDNEEMQTGLTKLIREILDSIKDDLGIADSDRYREFHDFWDASFYPRSKDILDRIDDPMCSDVTWEQVRTVLRKTVKSIKVRTLNGGNKDDKLDYSKYEKDGLNVIAIGGDKLSRGLTLEGLTTSYFIRTAKTYDSLLQMGRWFGFRFGYVDTCRIYTTQDLITQFREINAADAHLRYQIRDMIDSDKTPANYGYKIIQNDPKFRITQQNKMRTAGKEIGNPYSGSLKQTYKFQVSPDIVMDNFRQVWQLVSALNTRCGYENTKDGNYLWKNVPVDLLLKYIPDIKLHPELGMGKDLIRYISDRSSSVESPELTHWTVVLVNNTSKTAVRGKIAGLDVGYSLRNPKEDESEIELKGEYTYSKNQLLNNSLEEAVDLSEVQRNRIYAEMLEDYERRRNRYTGVKISAGSRKPEMDSPGGSYIRHIRSVTNGLLLIYPVTWEKRVPIDGTPLIGLAYSFPVSNTALSEEFVTNKVYQKQNQEENDF